MTQDFAGRNPDCIDVAVCRFALETRVIQDRAPTLFVRERRFALHEHGEDIAVRRICDATRVRSYVTLSSTARQP
jgi:hypothetical protein